MNIKAITRAMELSDDDWELATKLRALSETERELLMTALGPQKPAAKKSSKKAGRKSARAQSLGDAIQRRPRGVVTRDDADSDEQRCTVLRGDLGGTVCSLLADHNVHHLESVRGFHPFVSPASSAPLPSDQASSEIGKGAAGDVHHAASSGD